jgi:hypothetical protein
VIQAPKHRPRAPLDSRAKVSPGRQLE